MKTSTWLWIGAGGAALYFLTRRPAAPGPATSTQAQGIAAGEPTPGVPVASDVTVIDETDYYVPAGWGPTWGSYRGAWGGGGRRGGGGGHGGHGHHHGGGGRGRR